MPEYLSPGVYVEEFEIGAKPIEGVGTSTAGFVGMTERGALKPKLVDSFTKFSREFGGYATDSFTAYAVEGFFKNGGQKCYIARVVKEGSLPASLTVGDLTLKAVGPGNWGNRVAVRIDKASSGDDKLFKLVVVYWSEALPTDNLTDPGDEQRTKKLRDLFEKASVIEVFDNLSTKSTSDDHFLKRINKISTLIAIDETDSAARPENTAGGVLMIPLAGGYDAVGDLSRADMRGKPEALPGQRTGLTALSEVDEVAILYAPDVYKIPNDAEKSAFIDDMLNQCELLKDRFAIFDAPNTPNSSDLLISNPPFRPSKYGAIYYPWIKVLDPLTKREKAVPPGGHISGIYARTDTERGVHKAPANEVVKGASDVEFQLTKGEQDVLNPRHINCIRVFPGRGILVWGSRTMILDSLWKYINVRRLFIYLEESIDKGTQWVVFEPNDIPLWARVKQSITQFLTTVWRSGALAGATPEEAFFVKCDRTTMSQDDIDNGRLICVIGVAPMKPAEFVIFRIAQWTAGAKG